MVYWLTFVLEWIVVYLWFYYFYFYMQARLSRITYQRIPFWLLDIAMLAFLTSVIYPLVFKLRWYVSFGSVGKYTSGNNLRGDRRAGY